MLNARTLLRNFSALALFATAAWADTIVLKSGDKLEGKVLNETDTEVTVEVKITASIKDERIIKKADIEKIEKIQPDEQAWGTIKGIALSNESLDQSDYTNAVNMLGAFIAQFPQSAHAAESKEKLAQFEEEKKRVESGEMKLDGKWLSAAKVQEERAQINGRILLSRMKRLAAAGQYSEALNVYDAIEKSFNGTAAYPDAVALARQTAPLLKTAAEQRLTQLKQLAEQNKMRLANTQGADRVQLEAMLKQQQAATESAVAASERSGARWVPLNPANERSIASLISRVASEAGRFASQPVEKMRQSVQSAQAAQAALDAGDLVKADASLKEASSAWSNNELIKRIQPKLAELQKAAMAAKTAAAKADAEAAALAAKATPTPKPKPTPEPAPVAQEEAAPKKESSSIFAAPVFWVLLVFVLGLAALAKKFLGKRQEDNTLDQ